MIVDLPYISYMALYIFSIHIIDTNSRTSTHWKLDSKQGKVVQADDSLKSRGESSNEDDIVFNILTNKVTYNGHWVLEENNGICSTCKTKNTRSTNRLKTKPLSSRSTGYVLDCGEAVNYTIYDHLLGVANRQQHPEPEVARIFKKKNSKSAEVDMNELQKKLSKLIKEKPYSSEVHNQIGNFWRIKGDTQKSIECFRKALSLSPDNSDVLLNLARVLFNLQYLDDAILLTRRSLELSSMEQSNHWLQHYTLGEILKTYGHYQEASEHFQLALNLNPSYHLAEAHLREMELSSDGRIHVYTLFIIVFLVLGVLFGILSTIDANLEDYGDVMKTPRHFNRAMAMRSIKMGMNPRMIKLKKYSSISK